MRFVVPAVLLLVAAIHALPLLGVLGAARISGLYGIAVDDPNLEILMRHRAVLFGLLAAFLAYAAFHRALHGLGEMRGLQAARRAFWYGLPKRLLRAVLQPSGWRA